MKVRLYSWDGKGLAESATLEGNKGVVCALAFSPDGSRLASGDVRSLTLFLPFFFSDARCSQAGRLSYTIQRSAPPSPHGGPSTTGAYTPLHGPQTGSIAHRARWTHMCMCGACRSR